MPKRPDPAKLLQREASGSGRDAVYGGARQVAAPASQPTERAGWEARHKRVTFHCPLELLEAIEEEVRASGRRKNAVIIDALRANLKG